MQMKKKCVILVILLLQLPLWTILASVVFEDCGSVYELYAVNIAGCGAHLPCFVTLGEDVLVRLEFHTDRESVTSQDYYNPNAHNGTVDPRLIDMRNNFLSRKLDQDVVININHINLKTPVTPELCEIVNCPVSTDYLTSFTSVMTVPRNIALNQRGYLRWSIYNEEELLVLCYSVLVQTQSPLQKLLRQKFTNQTY